MNIHPSNLPTAKAAIKRLPVVIRDRIQHVAMPVEYDLACKALEACETIDEGKYWSDKADALAAWAKIYKNDQAALAARRLKLKAFRRMGEISEELSPNKSLGNKGRAKGPHSLLLGRGLTRSQASAARRLAKINSVEFKSCVERADSLQRATYLTRDRKRSVSDALGWLTQSAANGAHLYAARSAFRARHPHEIAAGIAKGEVKQARELAIELVEWLDAFEQALPKGK